MTVVNGECLCTVEHSRVSKRSSEREREREKGGRQCVHMWWVHATCESESESE